MGAVLWQVCGALPYLVPLLDGIRYGKQFRNDQLLSDHMYSLTHLGELSDFFLQYST